MSGETDGGLAFGVSVDLDEAGNLGDSTDNNGTAIFLSGAFGTLTVGNTDGAMDWALGDVAGPGTLTDNETAHSGFFGDYLDGFGIDGQIARYDYTVGDFGFAVSTEILDDDTTGVVNSTAVSPATPGTQDLGNAYSVGVKYALDLGGTDVKLGLAYQTTDFLADVSTSATPVLAFGEVDMLGVSAGATFGGLTAAIVLGDAGMTLDGAAEVDGDVLMIGASYTSGALTVGGNWGEQDWADNTLDAEGYGISVNYDLGGGAVIQAGYQDSEEAGVDAGSAWSLGIAMSF